MRGPVLHFTAGTDRGQVNLLLACVDDYVAVESVVRVVEAFVGSLDLSELGVARTVAAATGRPGHYPDDILPLHLGLPESGPFDSTT